MHSMNTKIQTLITLINLNKNKWCTFTPTPNFNKPCTDINRSIPCEECIFHDYVAIKNDHFTVLSQNDDKQNTISSSNS